MEDPIMPDVTLFPMPEPTENRPVTSPVGKPRVQAADRSQMQLRMMDMDSLVPPDHVVRAIWALVEGMDLSGLYGRIRAVEGRVGRSPIDPKIMLALWIYATVEGVGSARALDELCESHAAYQWIRGGVSVNYHSLSDFRTEHEEILSDLLTQSVATMMNQGLVDLKRVAQDGMRVRASAGAASFRREKTLKECQEEAKDQVESLRQELNGDPGASKRRDQAARMRAARERQERVEAALRQLAEVREKKRTAEQKSEARVSTTDADARVMKMADGGFRPAYNVEFGTDTATQVIVGVDVVNAGSDHGQMVPMVEQIEERHERKPEEVLVDGGFAKRDDIEKVTGMGVTVYAPVQCPKDEDRDPHVPCEGDSEAIAAWRVRMGTAQAKEVYKERAATAECVNAQCRNRGLRQFLVRGLRKVRAVALWYALAHNLMRMIALGAVMS
jgi:transposase